MLTTYTPLEWIIVNILPTTYVQGMRQEFRSAYADCRLFRRVDPHGVSRRRRREYTQYGLIRNSPIYTQGTPKVRKSQQNFFLKFHCPKSDRNFLKDFCPSLFTALGEAGIFHWENGPKKHTSSNFSSNFSSNLKLQVILDN